MEHIRKATAADKDQIYQLICDLEDSEIDKERFFDIYDANMLNPSVCYFVYEKDQIILGFLSLHMQKLLHHAANISEIQEMIVNKYERGAGVGKRLFQEAKKVSIEHHCSQMEVCCNQKRTSSHGFYQRQGMANNHYKFCLKLL